MGNRKELSYHNAIFDLDGTILDSMKTWENLGREYLISIGIIPDENLNSIISAMTLEESAQYFKETYHIDKTRDELIYGIHQFIKVEYEKRFQAKEYIKGLIIDLFRQGKKMCVLTTTEEDLAIAALQRLELDGYFEAIFTARKLKMDKRTGDIYIEVCKRMNYEISQTMVFEDAVYAVRSAKEAGCMVTGVFDFYSKEHQKEIMGIADDYISENELNQM